MSTIKKMPLMEEIKSLTISVGGKDLFPVEIKDTILRIIDDQPDALAGVESVVKKIRKICNNRSSSFLGCESCPFYGNSDNCLIYDLLKSWDETNL